jgi:putative nucleotidyltransferase with HDIG domain
LLTSGDLTSGDLPTWAYDAAKALMQSLKAVDPLTYYHCCRVGELSRKLARDLSLTDYQQKIVEFAGLFHDVGKIAVPQTIIHKPGKLDNDEFEIMKKHPEVSEEIVKSLSHHEFFNNLLRGIRNHHERFDGRGYPDGLAGEQIPLIARVILVADTYDAMTQTRSYRKGLPAEAVYLELQRCSGSQFDSQIAKVFIEVHPQWEKEASDPETQDKLIKQIA